MMSLQWVPLAGATFLKPSGDKQHLFVVANNPAIFDGYGPHPCVVVLSVTTLRNIPTDDEACILNEGDHPFIKHRSYVAYRHAEVMALPHLDQ
jgi:hypothetical protein